MIIKKVKLNNIRSYRSQEVTFPNGSTLLAGNIGSGKSTILLSVDFALFGITKETPGTALLRNGENEGSVELHINLNNKDIIIKRNLKRTPSSVSQESGYIIENDQKQELTAMELKQRIIELLNYPSELLTKTKSLIYNYTVYSPQEKMKEILLSSKEHRLEILRKVFGIDKYKRVRNNTEIFITILKQKTREIAAQIADLEQKEEELSERKQKSIEIQTEINSITPQIENSKIILEQKNKEILELENQIKETQIIKHEIEKTTININHKLSEKAQLEGLLNKLTIEIPDLEKKVNLTPNNSNITENNEILEQEIKKLEDQSIYNQKKITELQTRKSSHERRFNDITSLEICPTCEQKIDPNHKYEISQKESKEIEKINKELLALEISVKNNTEILTSKKEKRKKSQELQASHLLINSKVTELKTKKQELIEKKNKIDNISQEISNLTNQKVELELKIKEEPNLENNILTKKQEIDNFSQSLKELEIKKASLESEGKILETVIKNLEQDVIFKRTGKTNIEKLKQLREWLEKQFINMILIMEKNIMLRVHSELENLIQKWFSMLVDSETIKISLNEEFTPIIEQNNHNIDYLHLSGGEKTAAALSYRLALNQVINTLMSTINTKNILMLDEPTDGFSNEQIDRMRNILEELKSNQTIIVSHDPKIESFVDNVLKLEKTEHSTDIKNNSSSL
jgi:DNA repair protein SbcC/Rad50